MLGQLTFFTIKVLVKSHFGPQTLILYKLVLQLLIYLFVCFIYLVQLVNVLQFNFLMKNAICPLKDHNFPLCHLVYYTFRTLSLSFSAKWCFPFEIFMAVIY